MPSGGSYRLTILGQTTIRPTLANIRILAPEGMRFTTWSEGIRIQNHAATWEGVLQGTVELEVSFEAPPLPVRVWRAISDLILKVESSLDLHVRSWLAR